MKLFKPRSGTMVANTRHKRWVLIGPWIILITVGLTYVVRIRQPITTQEWWGMGFMGLGWIGMALFQVAILIGRPSGLVRPRKS